MPSPFFRNFFSLLLVAALLAGCREHEQSASNEHLKAGMIALDQGDEVTAERELLGSLQENPRNAEARVHLASIYAKHAGFPLQVWLDPLLNAGKQVDSKMKAYSRTADGQQLIDNVNRNTAETGEITSDTENADAVKVRIRQIYENLGKLAAGTMIAIDLFDDLPYLDEAQLAALDKAIQILRDDNENPDLRQEKVKVYLTALSLMRFIHYTRAFVGGFDHEATRIFTESSRFCSLDASEVRTEVMAIHQSLLYVEEGLRIRDDSVTNDILKSRQKMHEFVKQRLLGPVWGEIEKFFDQKSEEHFVVMRYARSICGAGKRPGSKTTPEQKVPGTGANLFNPDEG